MMVVVNVNAFHASHSHVKMTVGLLKIGKQICFLLIASSEIVASIM